MYDIVIQAGHEGGYRNASRGRKVKSSGTPGVPGGPTERHLTPIVADNAAAHLANVGYNVKRVSALYPGKLKAKLSISIHFDGSTVPCRSGASIGYPKGVPAGSNLAAAKSWQKLYSKVWPFGWMDDNFTKNLSGYYGYGWVRTTDAEMVIELGELTCPEQQEWLVARTESGYLGQLIAHWASVRLGDDRVVMPTEPVPKYDVEAVQELLIQAQETRANVIAAMSDLQGYLRAIANALPD